MTDNDIDTTLDEIEAGTDALTFQVGADPDDGSSGAPAIPPPLRQETEDPDVPIVLDDIEFTARLLLRRCAAWRAAAC
jgi:hypothetical protein